jgi:hypothetical protein
MMRKVALEVVKLATEMLDTVVSLLAGTVYSVVTVVADGLDCPRIFFATLSPFGYAPMSMKVAG